MKNATFPCNFTNRCKGYLEHIVSAGEEDKGLVFCYEWVDIAKCPEC